MHIKILASIYLICYCAFPLFFSCHQTENSSCWVIRCCCIAIWWRELFTMTATRLPCTSSSSADCSCACTVGPAPVAGGAKVVLALTHGPVCIHGAACSALSAADAITATAGTVNGYANCGNVLSNCLTSSGTVCTSSTAGATTVYATSQSTLCKCNCYLTAVSGKYVFATLCTYICAVAVQCPINVWAFCMRCPLRQRTAHAH